MSKFAVNVTAKLQNFSTIYSNIEDVTDLSIVKVQITFSQTVFLTISYVVFVILTVSAI